MVKYHFEESICQSDTCSLWLVNPIFHINYWSTRGLQLKRFYRGTSCQHTFILLYFHIRNKNLDYSMIFLYFCVKSNDVSYIFQCTKWTYFRFPLHFRFLPADQCDHQKNSPCTRRIPSHLCQISTIVHITTTGVNDPRHCIRNNRYRLIRKKGTVIGPRVSLSCCIRVELCGQGNLWMKKSRGRL